MSAIDALVYWLSWGLVAAALVYAALRVMRSKGWGQRRRSSREVGSAAGFPPRRPAHADSCSDAAAGASVAGRE